MLFCYNLVTLMSEHELDVPIRVCHIYRDRQFSDRQITWLSVSFVPRTSWTIPFYEQSRVPIVQSDLLMKLFIVHSPSFSDHILHNYWYFFVGCLSGAQLPLFLHSHLVYISVFSMLKFSSSSTLFLYSDFQYLFCTTRVSLF